MFTVGFLAWLVLALKRFLGRRVREAVGDGQVTVNAVAQELYPSVRATAYVLWMAQMGMVREQAGPGVFLPSMPGVALVAVERFVREELRIVDGTIDAPVDTIVERLGKRLYGVAAEVVRQSVRDALGENPERVDGAGKYTRVNGGPVARVAVAQGRDEWWVRQLQGDREFSRVAGLVRDAWQTEFGSEPVVDPGEVADWEADLLKQMGVEVDRELRRSVVEAEIFLGERDKYGRKIDPRTRMPVGERVYEEPEPGEVEAGRARAVLQGRRVLEPLAERRVFISGWARVPTGAWTCPFCLLLASRGPVYRSNTVLDGGTGFAGAFSANAYHPNCDCIAVPVYGRRAYEGHEVVDAAEELYRAWVDTRNDTSDPLRWVSGAKPADYARWLRSDRGRAKLAEVMPKLSVADDMKRVRERITGKKQQASRWWMPRVNELRFLSAPSGVE